MLRKSKSLYAALCGLILLFVACDNGKVLYDNSVMVGRPTWSCDSVAQFSLLVEDTTAVYRMGLRVRNDRIYEYQNIWLFVDEVAPDGTITNDTVQFMLADNFGRWTGSGLSSLYSNLFLYRDSLVFSQKGEYRYYIKHGMRHVNLKGISDVGIKIECQE